MRRYLLALALLSPALPTAAATLLWPITSGGGACSTTLQACINSAAEGDTIVIGADEFIGADAYTAINESLTITRSLTLTAQPGIDAVFASGRNISVALGGGTRSLTLSRLTLQRGAILVSLSGAAAGSSVNINQVRVLQMPDVFSLGCAIDVQAFGGSVQPSISVGDNWIQASANAADVGGGICLSSDDSVSQAQFAVFRNRVLGATGQILRAINVTSPSAGSTTVSANWILGPRLDQAMIVQRRGTGSHQLRVDNNVITGQDASGSDAVLIQANSTVTVVNNTLVHSRGGLRLNAFDSIVSGRYANNLVAFIDGIGLSINGAGNSVSNSHNLVYAVGSSAWTPGASTLTINPLLESPGYPYPTNSSPVIGAGNAADLPALVLFDANGERRIALGNVDIGALEANGDAAQQLSADAGNTLFNEMRLIFPGFFTISTDRLQVTPIHTALPGLDQNLGVYLSGTVSTGIWSVFNQNVNVAMNVGQRFMALVPVGGKTSISHLTTLANLGGNLSRIEDPELNARPYMVAIALHRWEGVYHDQPIGLQYTSAGGGRWQLRNENAATAMPEGLAFNILAAPAFSPNAFRTTLTRSGFDWPLEHPLLDHNPCAVVLVGRADDPDVAGVLPNPVAFAVDYRAPSGAGAPGRWYVRSEGAGNPNFPANAAFHVIIDGQQSNRCRAPQGDSVFANGFE